MAHGEFCRRRTGNFDARARVSVMLQLLSPLPRFRRHLITSHVGWKFDFSIANAANARTCGPASNASRLRRRIGRGRTAFKVNMVFALSPAI